MATDRPDQSGARRAIGRDSNDTFPPKLGSAGGRARASCPLGILCHANADCVTAFQVILPSRAGTLRVGCANGKVFKVTSVRIDCRAGKSDLRNPARSGGELSHESFVTG